MSARRFTIHFSGQVQGVGFRYTARNVAGRFAVTGYVKNLRDGRVEIVAEGEQVELRRFVEAVARAMADYVRDTQVSESPATSEYTSFDVAF